MIYANLRRIMSQSSAELAAVLIYAIMAALIVYHFFEPQSSFTYLRL